jgi:hypothetical protein
VRGLVLHWTPVLVRPAPSVSGDGRRLPAQGQGG